MVSKWYAHTTQKIKSTSDHEITKSSLRKIRLSHSQTFHQQKLKDTVYFSDKGKYCHTKGMIAPPDRSYSFYFFPLRKGGFVVAKPLFVCHCVTHVTEKEKNHSYLRKFIEKRKFLCYTPNRYKKVSQNTLIYKKFFQRRMLFMLQVKSDTFQKEVMESKVPVLVDFFATWCGPCQMMGPVLEQLQAEYGEKAKVVKVDIDQAMDLAQKYRVMSVPNMVFFKGGQVADTVIGAVPASILKEKMDKLL